MKNKSYAFTNLVILGIGILVILLSRQHNALRMLVFATGVVFMVPAVINMIALTRDGRKSRQGKPTNSSGRRFIGWLSCSGALILGLIMCIVPNIFVNIYVLIFSIALILGGLFHIYMMARGTRPASYPFYWYILPLALLVGGVIFFVRPEFMQLDFHGNVVLLTGIGMIVFAVNSFVEMIAMNYALKHHTTLPVAKAAEPETTTETPAQEAPAVEDVESTEA